MKDSGHGKGDWMNPGVAWACLWAVLAYPTLAITENLGIGGMLAGVVAVAAGLWLAWRWLKPLPAMPWKIAVIGSGFLWLGILMAYLIVHPAIDTAGFRLAGRSFGASDADDALEVALAALQGGRYPYRELTFLENPITPLPGSLLLAAPFVVLGSSGLQNLFWLGVLWWGIGWLCRSPRAVIFAALVSVLLCPGLIYQVLQGTDYLANSIFVLVLSACLVEAGRRRARWGWVILWSVCLGIALSSRPNFMLGTPLVFMAWVHLRGWRAAVLAVVPCALAFVLLTLPFYLVDPEGFSPLHTANKLNPTGEWPWLPPVVATLVGLLAFAMGWRRGSESFGKWARHSFLVQALLVLANLVIGAAAFGQVPWGYAHFGMLALPWGLLACVPSIMPSSDPGRSEVPQPQSKDDSDGVGE